MPCTAVLLDNFSTLNEALKGQVAEGEGPNTNYGRNLPGRDGTLQ